MILEGLITTTSADGLPHLAPMGPLMHASGFLLRPFPTSNTCQNLLRHPEGVLHIVDDVYLLARAAVGRATMPAHRPADRVQGWILTEHVRALEFVVRTVDTSEARVRMNAEILHTHVGREWFGFNRARHAVLEAAILATRLHLIPAEDVAFEFGRLRVIVEKTGGDVEREAMEFLEEYRRSAVPRDV